MAKRVNTQFVVILSAAVCAAAAVGVWVLISRRHTQDPKLLLEQAKAREAAGDMPGALKAYNDAAVAEAQQHVAGADGLFTQISDMAMKMSSQATTPEDGMKYFKWSREALQNAQFINPRNAAVNDRLIEDQYQIAKFYQQGDIWKRLADLCSSYIKNMDKPVPKPFEYRAEATLRQNQLTVSGDREVPDATLNSISDDLTKALQLDPNYGKAVALGAELLRVRARRAEVRGAAAEASDLRGQAEKQLREFLAKNPNDSAAVLGLSEALIDITPVSGASTQSVKEKEAEALKRFDQAIEIVKPAFAEHPDDVDLGERLARLYAVRTPTDVETPEKIYKAMAATRPESPESYFRLALFYRANRMAPQAVENFKTCVAHIRSVGGPDSYRIQQWQLYSFDAIAGLDMDMAEKTGADTTEGTAAMAEEAVYADKLRGAHGDDGTLSLLDGRAELIKRNIPKAMELLHRAESNIKSVPEQAEPRRLTKVLLAQANLLMQPAQLGSALKYLDEALAIQPNSAGTIVERASVLNQLGRFAEARQTISDLLTHADRLPDDMLSRAKTIQMQADAGSTGVLPDAGKTDDPKTMMALATVYLSVGELEAGTALLDRLLKIDEYDRQAVRLKALVLYRTGKKDEAGTLVDGFLTKFPNDDEFKFLKATINRPTDSDPVSVFNVISDPFLKNMNLSGYWHTQKNPQKELESLQAAEGTLTDFTTIDAQQKRATVIDRIFVTSVTAALDPANESKKDDFWNVAQKYVDKAVMLNLDGVGGRLYRGRMEFLRTDGKSGLNLIEQAVKAAPDYGLAHSSLGQAYLNVKPPRFDDALREYKEALRALPNDLSILRTTVGLLLQSTNPGAFEEAQALVKQGRVLSPQDPVLAQFTDRIADRMNDLRPAIQVRESMYAANKGNIDNRKRLAILYDRMRGADRAKYLSQAVDLIKPLTEVTNPDINDIVFLATLYSEQNRLSDAQKLFDPMVSNSDPRVACRAWLMEGSFLQGVGQYALAEKAFTSAIDLQKEGEDQAQRCLADLYFFTGNMAAAETRYQDIYKAAKEGDDKTLVLLRLVETMIHEGPGPDGAAKLKQADDLLQKDLMAAHPDDFRGLSLRAFLRIQQNRCQEALSDVALVLAKDKNNADAIYYRAMAQTILHRDVESAASDLQTISSRVPGVAKYHILLADMYRELRHYTQASNEYALALQARPDMVDIRREYAGYLMSLALVEQRIPDTNVDPDIIDIRGLGPTDRLKQLLGDSLTDAPALQLIWYVMIADVQSLTGHVKECKAAYADIYDRNPATHREPILVLGYMKTLNLAAATKDGSPKDYETAAKIATEMIDAQRALPAERRQPIPAEIFLRRATAYVGMHQEGEAKKDLELYIDEALLEGRGTNGKGDYNGFFNAITSAINAVPLNMIVDQLKLRLQINPNDQLSGVALLRVYVGLKQGKEAAKLMETLNVPADDKLLRLFYLKESGMAHYLVQDKEAARKDFTELLQLKPDDVQGLNNFAYILSEGLQSPKEALTYAQKAANFVDTAGDPLFNPAAGSVYDTYGWCLSLNGDYKGAVTQLQRSLIMQPATGTYMHLAETFLKMKQPDNARDAISKGRDLAIKLKDGSDADFDKIEVQVGLK